MTTKVKKIRATFNFNKMSDTDLLARLNAVHDAMNGNTAYPSPPVDMAAFKTAIDSFTVMVSDALDGGTKAKSAKQKQRGIVIKDVTQLGHYVEAACNDDLATFNTSGFVPVTIVRTPPQPLPPATFKYIDRGANSGQVVVKVTKLASATSYDVRYAVAPAAGASPTWTTQTLTTVKPATISNLTPGTTYLFSVRALGKLGYTDWSESMSFIVA